ncbi:MAG: septum formation protein Maf [Lachnospiraceae bacterium]|nr:septum formation protein Maf [Lachnospiraceae bacterium]
MKYRIVLASGSPRRKEILAGIGASYEVIVSDCDESTVVTEPVELVKELSYRKAEVVAKDLTGPVIVIGADTVVVYNGSILGKPKDRADAKRMISMLADDTHQVYTGVSLIVKEDVGEQKVITFAECSEVSVDAMTDRQIEEYLDTGEGEDKAGSYAVQGIFAVHIKGIKGDYFNIVGLPVAGIYKRLYEIGIDLKSGEKI